MTMVTGHNKAEKCKFCLMQKRYVRFWRKADMAPSMVAASWGEKPGRAIFSV
jgi:hypothetical protein